MATALLDVDTPVIPLKEAHRFIEQCMEAIGTPTNHANALADLLIEADYRGHYSHGMNRLDVYIDEVKSGISDPNASPTILKETPATAWVDGCTNLGVVVGNFCMDLAINKAKNVGIGMVVAKRSNHYGIAGHYSLKALERGLLGLSMTNTAPAVALSRNNQITIGTNPLSLAAPALNGDSFVLDMATSAVALGKLEIQNRKNLPVPERWCHPSSGALYPLGGDEVNSGYKGTGLGLMVEILCGILAGSSYGPNIKEFRDFTQLADLGQCFVAIDPACFAPGFEGRLEDLISSIRRMEPVDQDKPVLIAGDPERMHMTAVDKAGGVKYVQDQLETCKKYASELNVENLKPLIK